MKRTTAAFTLALLTSSGDVMGQDKQPSSGKHLLSVHQRCVIDAFADGVKHADKFNPDLVDQAIANCEWVLEPLQKSIVAKTADKDFAESQLRKIREASRRGLTVALLGYIVTRGQ
jgi:hypothetical protein